MTPAEQDRYFHILERLVEGGHPVRKFRSGFELPGGGFLCGQAEMNWLKTSGYVQKTADDRYEPTPLGMEAAGVKPSDLAQERG